jgi:hypothetical protein
MTKISPLIVFILLTISLFGQQDTVFITKPGDNSSDTMVYKTDTILVDYGCSNHVLIGTSIIPNTQNQLSAWKYGLFFSNIKKSECLDSGEEGYQNSDIIHSVVKTDTSLVIDVNVYDNCCYDFLCDISVDKSGTLHLIYDGYGTLCACNCCFGLTYYISKENSSGFSSIKSVMIHNNRKSRIKLL